MTAADISVIVQPTISTYYPEYSQISTFSTLAANTINAFKNDLGDTQNLVLGGSSNVHVESIYDVNVYMNQGDFQLFRSTYDGVSGALGRDDYQILGIGMDPTTSNAIIYSPSNAIQLQAGDPDNTYILGGFSIYDSNNYTVFGTTASNGFMFKSAFNVERLLANSDMVVASNLYVNGHVMGKDLNVFKDTGDTAANQVARVGYAFRINDKDQLELIKYSRFYNDLPDAQKKVAVFGMKDLQYTDTNDAPEYVSFGDLTNVSFANGKTGTRVYGSAALPYTTSILSVDLPDTPNFIAELDPAAVSAYQVHLPVITPELIGTKGVLTVVTRKQTAHDLTYDPVFTFTGTGFAAGTATTPAPVGGMAIDEITYLIMSETSVIASIRNVMAA